MTVLDSFRLDGKVAVVTGGNRGLGEAFARALSEAGARVAIAARDHARSQAVAGELGLLAVRADITDPADVHAMLDEVTRELGPVDVLVNNAGACFHRPALEVTEDEWREVWDVNVDGLWHCSRIVGAQMVERGTGTIVNIGSISAMIVNRPQMQPAYNASKAAVHQLTKSLAAEWAPHGVRVNALAPGYVKTEMAPVDRPEFQRHWVEDVTDAALRDARGDQPVRGLPRQRRVELHDRLGAGRRRRIHAVLDAEVARRQPALLDAGRRPLDAVRGRVRPRGHRLLELLAREHECGAVVGRPAVGQLTRRHELVERRPPLRPRRRSAGRRCPPAGRARPSAERAGRRRTSRSPSPRTSSSSPR